MHACCAWGSSTWAAARACAARFAWSVLGRVALFSVEEPAAACDAALAWLPASPPTKPCLLPCPAVPAGLMLPSTLGSPMQPSGYMMMQLPPGMMGPPPGHGMGGAPPHHVMQQRPVQYYYHLDNAQVKHRGLLVLRTRSHCQQATQAPNGVAVCCPRPALCSIPTLSSLLCLPSRRWELCLARAART